MTLKETLTDVLYSFGIDVGTSSCLIAYKEPAAKPKVPSYRGSNSKGIPSLFMRDKNGNEWAGDQVVDRQGQAEDPNGVCESIKMNLAEDTITLNGHAYTPREIAVRLVERVMQVSREALDLEMVELAFSRLVCGVPVRFRAKERAEMKAILMEAIGKDIQYRLVHEPVLAAVANDYFLRRTKQDLRPLVVFDSGAGTTDVVLLEPNKNPTARNPHPYITHEDSLQGNRDAGDVLDEKMEELLLEKVKQNPGTVKMSILLDKKHADRRRLRQTAKEAKERLSNADSCAVSINGLECGSTMVQVTRKEYEDRIRPVLDKWIKLVEKVFAGSGMGHNSGTEILLVGGTTYIPLLRQMLEEAFPKSQIHQRFPEQAVALGAAIYAELAEDETPVLPKVAYGYAVNTYIGNVEKLEVMIPTGAKLPMTVTSDFYSRNNNQFVVAFKVYEVDRGTAGEYLLMNQGQAVEHANKEGQFCEYKYTHQFGRSVPKGTEVSLAVTLSQDGILTMRSKDEFGNMYEDTLALNGSVPG